jgi:hypothetical protein
VALRFDAVLAQSASMVDHLQQLTGPLASYDEIGKLLARFKEPLPLGALAESVAKATKGATLDLDTVAWTPGLVQKADDALLRTVAVAAEQQLTAQGFVDQIVEAIRDSRDTKLQKALWYLAVPLLIGLFLLALEPYAKKLLETPQKQQSAKGVKKAARQAVGRDARELLETFRFVRATQLTVRATPRARAPAIGQLRFGQVVRVLEKTRDFTLVEWKSDDGKAEVQGWVFSRYLQRFD